MKKIFFFLFGILFIFTSLFGTPKVIVFDFGGVMTGEPNREVVINFICESFHLTKNEFEELNVQKRQATKQGQTDEEFWLGYAKNRKMQLPGTWKTSFQAAMREAISINPKMYDLVRELKKKYKVAMLSNIDERLSKIIQQLQLYQPFDPCLLSCNIGCEKPDPIAFAILIKHLQVLPEDIIFIDDRHENIEAAKKMGIDAILFDSEEKLREAFSARGVLE